MLLGETIILDLKLKIMLKIIQRKHGYLFYPTLLHILV